MTNELVQVIEGSGLEVATANYIKEQFIPFFDKAIEWRQKAEALVVTDISQTREMKMAREARLALKEIRVSADKTRKQLKEDSLRYGKAVQGVYNLIEYLIAPIEKHLQEQEDFVVIQDVKRKAEIKASREVELQPFAEFVPFGLNLGEMSEEDYVKTLNGAKLQLQAKIEAEQKAEAERIAREKAEAEERERIRIENERLKAEAEEMEKQLAEERTKAEAERKALEEKARQEKAAAEAKLRAEREAKEKLEAELKAKAESEARAKRESEAKAAAELKAKQDAERNARHAPDMAKLSKFAKQLSELAMPDVKGEDAQNIVKNVNTLIQKVITYIDENMNKI